MERQKKNLADPIVAATQRNKIVIISITIINIILIAAYYVEVLKKARTVGSYLFVVAGCIIPTVLYLIVYFKKKDSIWIRYISTAGLSALYSYIMLTTTTNMAFCYILLLFTILTIYADLKLSLGCSIYAFVINVVVVIKKVVTVGVTGTQIAEIEIVLICIFLAGLFAILVTATNSKINTFILEESNKEKEQLSTLLQTILKVSEAIVYDVTSVSEEMQQLETKITTTECDMEKLSKGAKETTFAVETQKENTQQISSYIESVESVTKEIGKDTKQAEDVLGEGQAVMDNLLQQVAVSQTSSNQVAKEMAELKAYTDKMQGIMALINNVASQTGLLALNASIEAARAGEAGRGFAVVASEISNLASQTSNATGDINGLIQSISKSLQEVVTSVDSLLDSNRMQNTYVSDTADNLEKVHKTTDNIMKCSKELAEVVKMVSKSNTIITESIQNIAVVMEDVTQGAQSTLVSSRENKVSVSHVAALVEHLNENAQELIKK